MLDPFAVSDIPLREAVAAGRRVIATNINPLVVLLLRERLSPPEPAALKTAVTRLGDSLKR
ncbi:MAG: type II modification methylase, partial [Armatimonadetes bacterium]|nr:type II modification methylase [Armatimonadota bacterium]NIO95561.1 type II modification methylase [Armatimonadota bacterium]